MEFSPEQLGALALTYGIKVGVAALIWFAGTTVAKVACNATRRILLAREGMDPSVANFAARALNWLFIGAIVVAILDLFNIETTGIIAVLGAATLAVGLALKDTLANFAAGVMILLFRPFGTGDFITVSGETGTVRNINLFRTEIATVDNVQVIIPNKVGACIQRFLFFFAFSKNEDFDLLTGSVRQNYTSSHHLVRMPGVNTQTNGNIYRFIKFDKR